MVFDHFCWVFSIRVSARGILFSNILDTNLLRSVVAMALMTVSMRMRSEWTWLSFVLVWLLDVTKLLQKNPKFRTFFRYEIRVL